MSKEIIVKGIVYEELSMEELEVDIFHLAGEDTHRAAKLMTELQEAIIARLVRMANDENADGKTAVEKAFNTIKDREEKRHQTALNKNMADAIFELGLPIPEDCDVHHLVAWHDKRARRAREILRYFGIDIDSRYNGAYLPKDKNYVPHPDMPNAYPHKSVHRKYYYLNLTALLEQVLVAVQIRVNLAARSVEIY